MTEVPTAWTKETQECLLTLAAYLRDKSTIMKHGSNMLVVANSETYGQIASIITDFASSSPSYLQQLADKTNTDAKHVVQNSAKPKFTFPSLGDEDL